jgi:hypothetical protein
MIQTLMSLHFEPPSGIYKYLQAQQPDKEYEEKVCYFARTVSEIIKGNKRSGMKLKHGCTEYHHPFLHTHSQKISILPKLGTSHQFGNTCMYPSNCKTWFVLSSIWIF